MIRRRRTEQPQTSAFEIIPYNFYTTNAIESLNRSLRKVIKTKGAFPNDASILKIFYLALINIAKKWTMPIHTWKAALSQFAIKFAGQFEI